jgi:hypothetical protein
VREDAGDDGWWVFETGDEGPPMDVIEGLRVDPFNFCVFDLEAAILGST